MLADYPIRKSEDDTLGRTRVAKSFAAQVFSLDATEGVVVGVLGPWGSGKTSFVNLARTHLEADGAVLDFNPWMFSGLEQLTQSFFLELSAQLKLRPGLSDVGAKLDDYGEIFSGMGWLPLLGPWIERGRGAAKILAKVLQRRKEGVGGRRVAVEKALAALDKPIVVVVDDIDRLTTPEIRDIFKLVRLTANFPNMIYIVAFDRTRVERALGEDGLPGRDFLEKILQVAVDLPVIPGHILNSQIFRAVNDALSVIDNPGPFDQDAWDDIFIEVIRPLICNMRDVRRYAVAVQGTVRDIEGQIALADVLALEAIRVFLPDVFQTLPSTLEGLTTTSAIGYASMKDPPQLKQQVEHLIEVGAGEGEVVRAMIERLFPAAQRHIGGSHYGIEWKNRWLRGRRVAHSFMLGLYLERVVGEGLQAFNFAEEAWTHLADRVALENFLHSLEPGILQDVVSSLEAYEGEFAPEHVVPGTIVLLNLLPELPKRERGMIGLDTRMVVGRVTYRLLRSLKDPELIESAVHEILPELTTLSAKLEVIVDVGYRENAGHQLVTQQAAGILERDWRDEVRSASVEGLVREPELVKILLLTKSESDPDEVPLEIPDSPQMTLALLRSARSDAISQTAGSRAVRRLPRLAWDALVELYGDVDTLRDRIGKLKVSKLEGIDDLLELAERYLGG